jgi:NADH-quinone oxidoreductase subunit L
MELLAVFSPLAAFVIAFLFGQQLGHKGAQFVTVTGILVAACAAIALFFDIAIGGDFYVHVLTDWVVSGDFIVRWALRIDTLSVVMINVITIVSACVHIYSLGYMSHDEARGRFMAYLSLFTFAMLMLVTADNLLQLFFGWEGVGLASYLLIGFWNQKHSANAAAQKAFVVNRVGDFGLALGIMAIFAVFGTVNFSEIFSMVSQMADARLQFSGFDLHAMTVICLLLFVGAVGKSAQLGLHTWLPDAMEGPTPVSALIHAATMVTAGVFLVARMSPLFEFAPIALMVVTVVGACTTFVAATIGMTQFDIKRVIAYSTMSQLGYMFFALGVSAYGAAMFHLMTHAFFKALLFLGAGSVIHAMSDEQDMRNMGGVWKKIPYTYAFMWIGSLALAGIPFFAGYYSKDIVLEAAWADQTWFGHFAYWMGIAAALMTAFYSWRLIIMTFHGKSRASKKVQDHVHESPAVMLGPLAILATGAIFAGMVFYQPFVGGAGHHGEDTHHVEAVDHGLDVSHEDTAPDDGLLADFGGQDSSYIQPEAGSEAHGAAVGDHAKPNGIFVASGFWNGSIAVLPENDTVTAAHGVPFWVKKMPLLVGVLGILLAYYCYLWNPAVVTRFVGGIKPLHNFLFRKWYFDELYEAVFVKNSFKLGGVFQRTDRNIVDRYGPDGSAALSQRVAGWFKRVQTGYIYHYAFVMMATAVGFVTWFIFKFVVAGV